MFSPRIRASLAMTRAFVAFPCLFAAAAGLAPPVALPPPVATPAVTAKGAAALQVATVSTGSVASPAVAPRLQGQPPTVPMHIAWKNAEVDLAKHLSSMSSNNEAINYASAKTHAASTANGYPFVKDSVTASETSFVETWKVPLGGLVLAAFVAVVAVGNHFWRIVGEDNKATRASDRDGAQTELAAAGLWMAKELTDSSCMLPLERSQFAVAALASSERFDPFGSIKDAGRPKLSDSEINYGRQTLLEALRRGRSVLFAAATASEASAPPAREIGDAGETLRRAATPSGSAPVAVSAAYGGTVLAGARVRYKPRCSTTGVAMRGNPICAGVVITGGANGVGYAYADEFLKRGHRVVICDIKDPAEAVTALKEKYPEGSIYGTNCDVSSLESINNFVEFVKSSIRVVHYWINNAGINGGRRRFTDIEPETVEAVVKVNLGGILLCTHAAMRLMQNQAGVTSHIFNTVGSGVKGGGTPGYVAYGATKRGLPQMTESLVRELEEGVQGYDDAEPPGKVNCHTLSPGMVFTDLLLNDSTPELRKFPFGVLAAQPEEVAADIVPKVLGISGNGKSVEFLTTPLILQKFFERFILGKKSEYIDDDGNVIKMPGEAYLDNGVRRLY